MSPQFGNLNAKNQTFESVYGSITYTMNSITAPQLTIWQKYKRAWQISVRDHVFLLLCMVRGIRMITAYLFVSELPFVFGKKKNISYNTLGNLTSFQNINCVFFCLFFLTGCNKRYFVLSYFAIYGVFFFVA